MGLVLIEYFHLFDQWLVFAILVFLGVKMIYDGFKGNHDREDSIDLTKGFSLISLSTAVSIDSFGAGITLPAVEVNILLVVAVFGLTASIMTTIAMLLARKLKIVAHKYTLPVAGLVLIGLGINAIIKRL